jgi:phage shock protein PspC (stress-responsive transcriptional regulator)
VQQTGTAFQRGSDRILGGVCSGLAAGFHVDSLWVRLGFVLLAFAHGLGILLYVLLWLLMPEPANGAVAGRTGFASMSADLRRLWAEIRDQLGGKGGAKTSTPTSGESTTASPTPPGAPLPTAARSRSPYLGLALIAIGVIALANNAGFITWEISWPGILIAIGVLLLIRNANRKT